jgi:hypothetical protein
MSRYLWFLRCGLAASRGGRLESAYLLFWRATPPGEDIVDRVAVRFVGLRGV